MKFVYLTAQKYPSTKADPFFHRSMATAFSRILGKDFVFVVRGEVPHELKILNALGVPLPRRARTLSYFFYLPFLIAREGWGRGGVWILSYDPNISVALIFWRKILRFRYRVISDWHQLFEDWRDGYIAKGSDALVTTSEKLKKTLLRRCGAREERLIVAYGGVDPSPFQEESRRTREERRRSLGLPEGSFLAGYVGMFKSLGAEKGLRTMIDALAHLPEEISLVLVGGKPAEIEEYMRAAKERGVLKRCLFVRKQPFEKVVSYEMAMDVLVIPYPDEPHFREYGFPMKVWEYMAAGRPLVYSDLGIIGEALKNRAHSFVPGNAESLADAVRDIKNKPEEALARTAKNTKDVLAYTWGARAKNILDFIQQK